MVWIYLQESEELASRSESGSDQLPIVKLTPSAKVFFYQGWPKEDYPKLLSLKMYVALQEDTSLETLTSYMEDSHARTSALQDMEKAWKESEADCFSRCLESSKKSNPLGYSSKMCQQLPLGEDHEWYKKLPRWGMTVGGVLFPLANGLINAEKDGFILPNLMASDGTKGPSKEYNRQGKQSSMRNLVTISYRLWSAGVLSPEVCEKIMGYPSGWSELKPWAIQFVRSKRKKRLKS